MLAVFAMLGQIAIFAMHRPPLALSPFGGDEHALCLGANPAAPGDDRPKPSGDDLQCPVCKTLQYAFAILPSQARIEFPVVFAGIDRPRSALVLLAGPASHAQPRAPPAAPSRV